MGGKLSPIGRYKVCNKNLSFRRIWRDVILESKYTREWKKDEKRMGQEKSHPFLQKTLLVAIVVNRIMIFRRLQRGL